MDKPNREDMMHHELQVVLPPSGTPAYDALAEIGAAAVYDRPQLSEYITTYKREFLGEE